MGFPPQIEDRFRVGSVNMISTEDDKTANADKSKLQGLIKTLHMELQSATAVAQKREEEISNLEKELNKQKTDLSDALRRLKTIEKQRSADCVTVDSETLLPKQKKKILEKI